MSSIRIILCDQLSFEISSLVDIKNTDTVLMCELKQELTYVEHHPKKIAFLLASMRHFAQELIKNKIKVKYIKLDDLNNTQNLTDEVKRAIKELNVKNIIITEPSEYRLKKIIESWPELLNIKIEILTDNRFFCSIQKFLSFAKNKKQLRMEYFYREMRKNYNILMQPNSKPINEQWNYDKDNRKPPSDNLKSPKRISHKKSKILQEVLFLVKKNFSHHFGDLEPFYYAVTRKQALIELKHFIKYLLPYFGDYQDAMMKGEAYLYHSLLSSYINAGLLLPFEVCKMAEEAYFSGLVPINSAEGFIRQILGWREYVRGVYWLKMPEYANLNYLEAYNPLPSFYWGAKTNMACISDVVKQTKEHSYSHHIQRLMITGNFALLAALDVKEVQKWYLEVYSDAYEWVEMPNTLGMALFADGGILGSKPYAASGKYIDKMSNFCKSCIYNPKDLLGDKACPFNALYWDFLARNYDKLNSNQRLSFMYSMLAKFSLDKKEAIKQKAKQIIKLMQKNLL